MKAYIVVTYSYTSVAKLVRVFTNKPYSHVGFAVDENMEEIYSFGRKYPRFVIPGGFITDGINSKFYKLHPNTKTRVYELELTDEQKNLIKSRLKEFTDDVKSYGYGFVNIIQQYFNMPHKLNKRFTCCQFVTYIFDGILPFKSHISLVRPMDYCDLGMPMVFEGTMKELKESIENETHR